MEHIIIGNIITGISIILNIIVLNKRDIKESATLNIIAIIISLFGNFILGTNAGVIIIISSLLRNILIRKNKLNLVVLICLITINISVMYLLKDVWWDVFAMMGSTLSSIAWYVYQVSEKKFRQLRILANFPGGIFYLLTKNYSAFVMELYGLYTNIKILKKTMVKTEIEPL